MNRRSAGAVAAALVGLLAACADGSGESEQNRPDVETGLAAIADAAGTDQVQRVTSGGGGVSATMVTETGAERWTWTHGSGEVTAEEVDPSSTPEPRAPMDLATMIDVFAAVPGCAEGRSTFTITALGDAHSQTRVECDTGTEVSYYLDGEPAGPVDGTDPTALAGEVDRAAAVLGGEPAQVRLITFLSPAFEVVAAEQQPTLADADETCFPVYVAYLSGGSERRLRCATTDPGRVLTPPFDADVAVMLQEQAREPEGFDEIWYGIERGSPVYGVLSLSENRPAWYDTDGTPVIEAGRVGVDLEPGSYQMITAPTEECRWYVWEDRDGDQPRVQQGAGGQRASIDLTEGQVLDSSQCPFWRAAPN